MENSNIALNTIDEALKAIKAGELVIVIDDEDRENEGDFVCAAECITPDIVNFMAKHGRGQICAPITETRCKELGLDMMVNDNNALHSTAFTVPVDLKSDTTSTGISAHDRCETIKALIDPNTNPKDLTKPGHMFPLKAKNGGVLRRSGHTEAAVDLARLAGFKPGGVIVEIMNEDGSMARLPQLKELADKWNLKIITIKDLIQYRLQTESLIERKQTVDMPTKWGHFKLHMFEQINTKEAHLALTKGEWDINEPVMLRVHSSCVTGDIFGSFRCDCGSQLERAMQMVEKEGKGAIIYMNQEGRGIGLENKLKAYILREEGMDTVEANVHLGFKGDQRDYGVGAQIIRSLGIKNIRLISNNPKKRVGLQGYGLEIVENLPIEIPANEFNEKYLETKRDKFGHEILKK